eukprot:12954799-Ditylum_brightwellii.AAC.1
MYCGFSPKFTVGEATMDIPCSIGVYQGDDLAPLLFNIFFQAALDLLESIWEENLLPLPKFRFFSNAKSGAPRGRLREQSIWIGKEFSFEKSLYVDDGAFLFESRQQLQRGATLIFMHFQYFGLQMHVGSDGTFQDSKTEAVVFPPPGMSSSMINTSPEPVLDG